MTQSLELTNPDFTGKESKCMNGVNYVKCNKSKEVYKFIKNGKKFVIEIPGTNTILNVTCIFASMNSADMKITSAFVNGVEDTESEGFTISYKYDVYDSIFYSSLTYSELCNLYISVDDIFN
jgi:hypothetical protein